MKGMKKRKYPLIEVTADLSKYRFKETMQVRFNETDAQGIVNNAVYFTYFEVARVEYLRHVFSKYFFDKREFSATLGEAGCRFLSPLRFGQVIDVYVRVPEIYRVSYAYEYVIHIPELNIPAAVGHTTIVALSNEAFRPIDLPEAFVKRIMEYEGENTRLVG